MVPRPHSYYGPLCLFNNHEQQLLVLLQLILENPGIYLKEIQAALLARYGVEVAVFKTFHALDCSRLKIQHVASQQSAECRAQYMAEISMYYPATLVWLG